MITMELLGKIRRMHVRDKMSERAIAMRTGLSRNTVKKWLNAPALHSLSVSRKRLHPA